MSDSKQEIRDLLKKYALNKCTSVEIARLTTLFQQNEIDETDIDVVHILDSLGDTYNLDKGRAETIYQEVSPTIISRNCTWSRTSFGSIVKVDGMSTIVL